MKNLQQCAVCGETEGLQETDKSSNEYVCEGCYRLSQKIELDSELEGMVDDFIYYARHKDRNKAYDRLYTDLKTKLNQLRAADVLNFLIERDFLR